MIKGNRIIILGITGHQGRLHTKDMLAYGTKVVAGVTPGKGGQKIIGIPVFDSVSETKKFKPDTAILFVPADHAKEAAFSCFAEGLDIILITEHIPVLDSIEIIREAKRKKCKVLGPNCPGMAIPGKINLGIIPNKIMKSGNVGIVSRSGTLTYQVIIELTREGKGQSAIFGIGGDPIHGIGFRKALGYFEKDPKTKQIVIIGEIGGSEEEMVCKYIKKMKKPIVAYVAGRSAPPGKTMGHAGAIVGHGVGDWESKTKALKKAGVSVAMDPFEIPRLL